METIESLKDMIDRQKQLLVLLATECDKLGKSDITQENSKLKNECQKVERGL